MLPISEVNLISRLQNNEEQAFSILYQNYCAALYGIILKIVKDKDEADNILQDTFVKIWKNIKSYEPEKGRLFTWLLNIARNTAINYIRSKNKYEFLEIQTNEYAVYKSGNVADPIKIEEFGVKKEVQKLEKPLKDVIDLIYYLGYTQQEAAEKLNLPLGTVKTRTRSALQYLKNKIGTNLH